MKYEQAGSKGMMKSSINKRNAEMKCFHEFLGNKGLSLETMQEIEPLLLREFGTYLTSYEKRYKDGSVEPYKPGTASHYIGAVRTEIRHSDNFQDLEIWKDDELFSSIIKDVEINLSRARISKGLSIKDQPTP